MTFTNYITTGGERWDSIAYAAYGDSSKVGLLIANNPGMPVFNVFESGITLRIPIVTATIETNPQLLPPWKRGLSTSAAQAQAAAPILNEIKTVPAGSFDGGSFD